MKYLDIPLCVPINSLILLGNEITDVVLRKGTATQHHLQRGGQDHSWERRIVSNVIDDRILELGTI